MNFSKYFTYFFEKDFHDIFVTFVYSSQQWSDSKLVWSLINGGREGEQLISYEYFKFAQFQKLWG